MKWRLEDLQTAGLLNIFPLTAKYIMQKPIEFVQRVSVYRSNIYILQLSLSVINDSSRDKCQTKCADFFPFPNKQFLTHTSTGSVTYFVRNCSSGLSCRLAEIVARTEQKLSLLYPLYSIL